MRSRPPSRTVAVVDVGTSSLRMAVAETVYEGGVDDRGPYVRMGFELPRGAFATVVMREIMKNDASRSEADNA